MQRYRNINALFQIKRVRCSPRWVHADVRAIPVPGDPAWTGDLDRSRLRSGREWLRVQAEKFGERHVRASGCSKLLNVRRTLAIDIERAFTPLRWRTSQLEIRVECDESVEGDPNKLEQPRRGT